MNVLVSAAAIAAVPTIAPAMPITAGPDDQRLIDAFEGMIATDQAIADLHKAHGDDADSRADYAALNVERNEHIATLVTVPASSPIGIQAKARAVQWPRLVEEWDQHQQVACSLADDFVPGGTLKGFQQFQEDAGGLCLKADEDDLIFEVIAAYRRADAACASAPGGDIPDELGDRWSEAYDAVLQTRPNTPAGLSALTTWARGRTDWINAQGSGWMTEHLCTLFSTLDDATRGMSGLNAWSPPSEATPAQTPVTTAIKRFKDAQRSHVRLYDRIDLAESAATKLHGHRPIPLIAWRNYSHIGGGEIECARDRFLGEGSDPAAIEREYRDAKKREQVLVRAGRDWDTRTGLTSLRKKEKAASREFWIALKALASTKPRCRSDAVALIGFLQQRVRLFGELSEKYEIAIFRNASLFLTRALA